MRIVIVSIMAAFLLTLGCSSSQKTVEKKTTNNEKNDEALAKMNEERVKKENDEKAAREELEKKKLENEKQKMELKIVKERLRNMGLAVVFANVTRVNDVFRYPDGHTITVKEKVSDQGILVPLNELLSRQKEKNNEVQNELNVCSGGFEACQEGRLYIYFMERDQNGACSGAWYRTDQECKK
jgi:hypothetical protein